MTLDERIDQYVKDHSMLAEDLLETLGRIPSPTRQEDKRAAFVQKWFLNHGGEDVKIDGMKNVICAYGLERYHDIVVFAAHTDIVFPDTEPLPLVKDGDILRAPGIGDDTANLVNVMMSAAFIMENQIEMKKAVLFVANSCEEGMGNLDGTKELFRQYGDRITEYYSFDGYLSQCTYIPLASHKYKITVHVQGGHSYLNFGRKSAIEVFARIVEALYHQKLPQSEDKTTYNVGTVNGGTTINSIAQDVTALYEYRSSSQDNLSFMKKQLEEIIATFDAEEGVEARAELIAVRPGKGEFARDVLENFTKQSIATIQKYYDGKMDLGPYSTDSNIPLSKGITANTIGTIVGDLAHTRQEWMDTKSIPRGMRIVLAIMEQYMQQE